MELFENQKYTLPEKFRLFSDIGDVSFSSLPDGKKEEIRRAADNALNYAPESVLAGLYKKFFINGDRSEFDAVYSKKRTAILDLILGCVCFGCDKYKEKLLDVVWNVLEETSWVIPAHNVTSDAKLHGKRLPDAFGEDVYYIDLFSAVTGALLSLVLYYAGDALDGISDGIVTDRIKYELKRRIIKPYLMYDMRWTYVSVNNWAPWIVSNVLLVSAITADDPQLRRSVISKAQNHLNLFISTYGDDGGCNEGASYWGAAVAALFDACEIIYDMTGGSVDVFNKPFLKKACEFICDMNLSESKSLYVNFADCGRIIFVDPDMVFRMGKRVNSVKLIELSDRIYLSYKKNGRPARRESSFPYRILKSLLTKHIPCDFISPDSGDKSCFYPDLQVAVFKRGEFALAVKGGHNGESHNHNDVGNFVLYYGGEPVIIDMGNDRYRKETFNSMRYTLRENQSSYHNLPEFNGIQEREGKDFCADGFTFDESKGSVSVSYAGAYPKTAGVSECKRTLSVSESGVSISDTFVSVGDAVYNYMLSGEPRIEKRSVTVGNCTLNFSENADITCEIVDIGDCPKLSVDWNGDRLFRLRVKASGNSLSLSVMPSEKAK